MKITETVHVASVTGKGFLTFIVTLSIGNGVSGNGVTAAAKLDRITASNGVEWGNIETWVKEGKTSLCPFTNDEIEEARYIAENKARERFGYVA